MNRITLANEIKRVSLLKGEFELRSGKISNQYFDKYLFESIPSLLDEIITHLLPLIPPDTEILAGLEMGGIPIVTMLSQQTNIPCAFIRKESKKHGTCKYAEGPVLAAKQITLVEDIISSGGAVISAATKLRNDGVNLTTVICVIDREMGGKETLKLAGITVLSLFKMSEIV